MHELYCEALLLVPYFYETHSLKGRRPGLGSVSINNDKQDNLTPTISVPIQAC